MKQALTQDDAEYERVIRKTCTDDMDADREVKRLLAENAKLRAAYERANAEVFRLAELLKKDDRDWGQPMRLSQCRNQ